jgi:hypothetical protein
MFAVNRLVNRARVISAIGGGGGCGRAMRVLDELRGFKLGRWVNEIAARTGSVSR